MFERFRLNQALKGEQASGIKRFARKLPLASIKIYTPFFQPAQSGISLPFGSQGRKC
jgi:hypothetical protein